MKYLIASDFHGRVSAYKDLAEAVNVFRPDKVILLGDLCDGSGARSVNNELDKIFCQILSVRGNCDFPTIFDELHLGDAGTCYNEKIGDRTAFFTHGHIYGRNVLPPFSERGDVVFYGHYHFPEIATLAGRTCVCVGSAGKPRGGSEPTFCLFDGETVKICNLKTYEVIVEKTLEKE